MSCLGAHCHRRVYPLSLSFSHPFRRRFWFMRRSSILSTAFCRLVKSLENRYSCPQRLRPSVRPSGLVLLRFAASYICGGGYVNDCNISCIFSKKRPTQGLVLASVQIIRHVRTDVECAYQLCHVCLYICLSAYINSGPTRRIFMKFASIKICQENPNYIIIGQKCRSDSILHFYLKMRRNIRVWAHPY